MAAAAVVGAGIVILVRGADSPALGPIETARLSAVVQAATAGFLLDDPVEATVECAPSSLFFRRFLRLVVALPVAAAGWGVTLAVAGRRLPLGGSVPIGGLSLEFAALCFASLALASLASLLLPDSEGGLVAAPLTLAVAASLVALRRHFLLFATSPGPEWAAAHRRWWMVFGGAVLVVMLASGDRWRYRSLSPHTKTRANRLSGALASAQAGRRAT